MPRARERRRTQADSDRELVEAVATMLDFGRPTRFALEGPCRHGLRIEFCLSGVPWHESDDRANKIVCEALRQIGAVRPTWQQGQPEYCQDGFSPTEFTRCQNCGTAIDPYTNQNGRPRKYCGTLCAVLVYQRKVAKGQEQTSRVEYIARMAAQSATHRHERAKPCKHCGATFIPDHRREREQMFCSQACGAASRRREEKTCPCCGQKFRPVAATRIFCSAECHRQSRKGSPSLRKSA